MRPRRPAARRRPGSQTPAAESDLDYVKGNGVLKIGYTLFEPMNYLGEDGELTGFETEFATAVCAKLGVEPKFVEINWDAKLLELESKNIDCIWNGMTITPELQEAISISDPYIKNYQVVVIRAADADQIHLHRVPGRRQSGRGGRLRPVRRRLRPTSSSARPAIPLW